MTELIKVPAWVIYTPFVLFASAILITIVILVANKLIDEWQLWKNVYKKIPVVKYFMMFLFQYSIHRLEHDSKVADVITYEGRRWISLDKSKD